MSILVIIVGFIYVLLCAFLIFVVMLQPGKSGGMGGLGGGATALADSIGATNAEEGLHKVTLWAAGLFFLLALLLTGFGSYVDRASAGLELKEEAKTETPAAPATGSPEVKKVSIPASSTTAPAAPAPAGSQPSAAELQKLLESAKPATAPVPAEDAKVNKGS